jgi:hypothetical protein
MDVVGNTPSPRRESVRKGIKEVWGEFTPSPIEKEDRR